MDVYTSVVMAAIRRIIAAGTLLAGSFGCAPPFRWEGHWTGRREMLLRPDVSKDLERSLRRITLDVRTNGQFELVASGVPRTGLIHTSGRTATLETVLFMGRSVDKPEQIKVTANKDGTISLLVPDQLDPKPVVMTRESQPPDSSVRKP